jgi:hypothetical protein
LAGEAGKKNGFDEHPICGTVILIKNASVKHSSLFCPTIIDEKNTVNILKLFFCGWWSKIS